MVAEAGVTCKAERKNKADCRQMEAQRNSTPREFVLLKNANLHFWLAIVYLLKNTQSLLLAPAGWNSTGISLLYYQIQKLMTARQGEVYLPVFVVSDGFVAREDLCYWFWKMNRNFAQAGVLSPCDAFKKQSVFLLTLLESNINQVLMTSHFPAISSWMYLVSKSVHCGQFGTLLLLQIIAYFSSLAKPVSIYYVWPALQLITLSAFIVSPLVSSTFVSRMPRETF